MARVGVVVAPLASTRDEIDTTMVVPKGAKCNRAITARNSPS
jgi:hypothetical protein